VLALSTGKKLPLLPDHIASQTARQFEQEQQQSYMHFDALKPHLDRISPRLGQTTRPAGSYPL
jgi:hypothetical protein